MNLETVLAILKEVSVIVAALQAMGLKVEGTVNMADLLKLVGPK